MKHRVLFCAIAISSFISAQQKPSQAWLDQKFSMFIHFGLYSVYGGVYDGKPVERGYSEQIQSFAGIFSDWYAQTSEKFAPVLWNADSIVSLAKASGMKSIVFTSKHHDGFCMYHSNYTDFNIADATPYGKDLMKELADACKRGGMSFGVYFSLIDWHFPQAHPISSHNADPLTPEHYQFNLKQVEEIMTNYGNISEIWFDMGSLTREQSKGLYQLVNSLQPACMISGRLGNDYVDFAVMPDNDYPNYKLGVPWQTAASIFDETWGYRSWQKRGEVQTKIDEKIGSLVKVIARGGNYLLNIGPRGDGSVVEFERDVLLSIGTWVKANAEAIYGSHANPLNHSFEWGEITERDGNLYLFVRREFAEKDIFIDGFKGNISEVKVVQTGEECLFFPPKMHGKPHHIRVPRISPDSPFAVLKVVFKNGFSPLSVPITNKTLSHQNATPIFGHSSLNYYAGYKSLIRCNWAIKTSKKQVAPELIYTETERGRKIEITIDGKREEITLNPSEIETVNLPKNTLKWGNLYRKPGRIIFGVVEEEGDANINIAADKRWKQITEFPYGESILEKSKPRTSIVFLQEIKSEKEQEVAVEIESGNAVYVLLNGEYITAHFLPEREKQQKEIVLLPLKKGQNQLLIKFYNGYEKEFSYGINPLSEWRICRQKIPTATLNGNSSDHTISVGEANPKSAVAPLQMSNLKIKF